jgi:hypothetical protein
MDDKIFIREQEEPAEGGRSRMVMLAILALVLVAIGAGYFMFIAGKDDSDDGDNTPIESLPVVDNNDEEDTEDEPVDEEPVEEEDEEPVDSDEPDREDEPVAEEDFSAPEDDTKLHLYFPKADGTFGPSLRDKPESATTYVITEVLRGPNSTESAAGYTKTWAFSGSSQCGGSTFKYEVSGSTLKVTMCKDFSGSDIDKYIKALNLSITELGVASKVAVVNVGGGCMGTDKSCI